MANSNFSKLIGNVQATLAKNSPSILIGIGITGMVATTFMAVKATPKAMELLKEAENAKEEKLTHVEAVKATWKCYIPAAITGITSIACLIGASSVHARRNAALVTAYNVSKVALTEYKDKVVETIGEKKERVIRDSIAKDKVESNPVRTKDVIITEKGNTLCYDSLFGRYFKSDIDTIKRAVNEINRKMVCGEMYVSLNEFYEELNLNRIDVGDELGWNLDDGRVEVYFSSQIAEDGTPCIVISYNVSPKYGYSKYF